MDQKDTMNMNHIQDFYSAKNILITGSTGFLGIVILEKLLRSCPNISKIYLIIRRKKSENVTTRLENLTNDVAFERLGKQNPNFRNQIHVMEGDCSLVDLGISLEDKNLLIDKVNIIFHLAAAVSFNEKLKDAVALNVRATRDVLGLASQMQNLRAVMCVSTTYANYFPSMVDEKVYPTEINANQLIYFVENMPENILETVTPIFLGQHVNTYSYTKQIVEGLIQEHGNDLPIGIVRSSNIISAYREPIRSWTNSMFAVNGIVAYAALGLLRVFNMNKKYNANVVPVDMCANMLIAAAWEISTNFKKDDTQQKEIQVPVYNYDSTNDKPITWERFFQLTKYYHYKTPFSKCVWYFFLWVTQFSQRMFVIVSYLMHFLPAYILDGFSICLGKQPRMITIASRTHNIINLLHYFGTRPWSVKTDKYRNLISQMSTAEREIFFFDLRELNWKEYFEKYLHGMRIYLMKESNATIPKSKTKYMRFFWIHQVAKILLGLLLILTIYLLLSVITNLL